MLTQHRSVTSVTATPFLSLHHRQPASRTRHPESSRSNATRTRPHTVTAETRRLFITDAVLNGLPPHIAQIIAGHRDINVTMGYKAVYPDEAIQSHLAFLARRRQLRPTEEYRTPTDEEWQEFLGHPREAQGVGRDVRAGVRNAVSSLPWRRSGATSRTESSRPNFTAGSAKSKDSKSALPASTTNLPRSTPAPAARSTSEPPPYQQIRGDDERIAKCPSQVQRSLRPLRFTLARPSTTRSSR